MQDCHFELFAKAGDRWHCRGTVSALQLEQSWDLLLSASESVALELPGGEVVSAVYLPSTHELRVSDLKTPKGLSFSNIESLELRQQSPLTFRLIENSAPFQQQPLSGCEQEEVQIKLFTEDSALLNEKPVSWDSYLLGSQAADYASTPGFDDLICVPLLRGIELFEHQAKAAKTILQRFRGRGLLCDEVGLGKTIEAGVILLELFVRKLAKKILILTPPSLVEQWQGEMQQKFGLNFIAHDDPEFKKKERPWEEYSLIAASYHTAKRESNRSEIQSQHWDFVIIDEAHHLRNKKTLLWKFVSEIRKKYILLLTATPIQNGLEDLYSLVTLLKPGLLGTEQHFKKRFVDPRDKLQVRNLDQLHALVAESMVRNRRSTIGVKFSHRFAKTLRVIPTKEARDLYEEVTCFIKPRLVEASGINRMQLLTLQKLMGSTPLALLPSLKKMAASEKLAINERQKLKYFIEQAGCLTKCAKVERLLSLVDEVQDKMVVFTQFRQSQEELQLLLEEHGVDVAVFHGGLTRLQKEKEIEAFRKKKKILLSTDSGSEGRNLQFCNVLCNFDLPWNPMRIEQRIGRLSRIGQQRDVYVYNFAAAGTIEDHILYLLEAKVNLFEMVMGEMDMILGNVDRELEFEEHLLEMWKESDSQEAFKLKMEDFGNVLIKAKEDYLRQQAYEDNIFQDKFTSD